MAGSPQNVPENYPLAVKEIILGFLQEFFTDHPKYPFRDGQERDSGIKIHDKHAFNFESVGDKPALVIDRKQLRFAGASIDKNLGQFNLSGSRFHMDLINGTAIVHCLCKEGVVAEELAHIVFFALESFRAELRKRGLWDCEAVAIGEESILVAPEGTALVSVPVILNVRLVGKWVIRRASTQRFDDVRVTQQEPPP